jgi:hypothetical protein
MTSLYQCELLNNNAWMILIENFIDLKNLILLLFRLNIIFVVHLDHSIAQMYSMQNFKLTATLLHSLNFSGIASS